MLYTHFTLFFILSLLPSLFLLHPFRHHQWKNSNYMRSRNRIQLLPTSNCFPFAERLKSQFSAIENIVLLSKQRVSPTLAGLRTHRIDSFFSHRLDNDKSHSLSTPFEQRKEKNVHTSISPPVGHVSLYNCYYHDCHQNAKPTPL